MRNRRHVTGPAFEGRVAVVTGAASGLGRALASELARCGASVALCDVDEGGLAATADLVRGRGVEAFSAQVDVADREGMRAFAGDVRGHFGVVHQVYNNAGVALVGPLERIGYADLERVMAVNFWGVVHGTKEFLPHLIDSREGHIVNISSVFGLVAAPWMSGYDATKFAVRGFTEALRGELLATRRPVRVTCVHPGGIRTAIVRNAEATPGEDLETVERWFCRIAPSSPEGAARAVLRGVRRGKARVLVGADAYGIDVLQRLSGAGYQRVASLAARRFLPSDER